MATNAIWVNGDSIIPQARAASSIELAWANGDSGSIPFDKYVAAGGGMSGIATVNGVTVADIGTRNGVAPGDIQ